MSADLDLVQALAEHYAVPAAAALLVEGIARVDDAAVPLDDDERERARRALAALDLERALFPERAPLDDLAHGIGVLVAGMLRGADRHERLRLAALLGQVIDEARAIERRRAVA